MSHDPEVAAVLVTAIARSRPATLADVMLRDEAAADAALVALTAAGYAVMRVPEDVEVEHGSMLVRRGYHVEGLWLYVIGPPGVECECPRTWASAAAVVDLDHPIVLHEENCPLHEPV